MGWEVAALRIGQHKVSRSRMFYGYRSYAQADASFDMSFYFWVLRRGEDIVVVDTGFDEARFARQGADMRWAVSPADALCAAGIDLASVGTVILSHLHFDHIGTVSMFPTAEYVIQREEWAFWHGELGTRPPMRAHTDVGSLRYLEGAMQDGRVRFVDGREVLTDGVAVHPLPGHTPGQQGVVVDEDVVLASDAAHLYDEIDELMLFGTFTDAVGMYRSYGELRTFAEHGFTVVPGHDPAVMQRFPPLIPSRPELGVRLDRDGRRVP